MALSLQVLECQAPGGWLGVLLSSLCLGERLVKTFFDGQPRFEHPTWSSQSLLCPEPVLWSPCVCGISTWWRCGISTWWRWEECGEGPLWANKVFWFSPLPSYKAIERKGFWQTSGKGQRTNLHEMMPKNLSLLQSFFFSSCLFALFARPPRPAPTVFFLVVSLLCYVSKAQSLFPCAGGIVAVSLTAARSCHQHWVAANPPHSDCPLHLLLQWSFPSLITFLRFIFISVPDVTKVHKSVSIDFWQQSLLVLH